MKPPAKSAKILGVCLLTGTVASQQHLQQPLVPQPSINTASPSFDSLSPSITPLNPSINTASPSFNSLSPSLSPISTQPSLVPVGQVALGGSSSNNDAGYASCAAIGRASIPGCAMDCFATGAAALGCAVHDLGCQCRQQARMMAAAEGCVAEACPGAAYQRVIDGAMSMCGCAVGVATAEVSGFIARPGPTASVSVSASYMSGSFSVVPSLTVINGAAGTVTPSLTPQVDPPSQVPPVRKRDLEEDHGPRKSFDPVYELTVQAKSGTSSRHRYARVVGWAMAVLPTLFVGIIL